MGTPGDEGNPIRAVAIVFEKVAGEPFFPQKLSPQGCEPEHHPFQGKAAMGAATFP